MTQAHRVITLTDHELVAEATFHDLLDQGESIRSAVQAVRIRYRRSCRAVFYRWLLGGNAR